MPESRPNRGDTVVGHDGCIGWGAAIMPGPQIGNGAIIAAGCGIDGILVNFSIGPCRPVGRMVIPGSEWAATPVAPSDADIGKAKVPAHPHSDEGGVRCQAFLFSLSCNSWLDSGC
jgi:hypothetical protein